MVLIAMYIMKTSAWPKLGKKGTLQSSTLLTALKRSLGTAQFSIYLNSPRPLNDSPC